MSNSAAGRPIAAREEDVVQIQAACYLPDEMALLQEGHVIWKAHFGLRRGQRVADARLGRSRGPRGAAGFISMRRRAVDKQRASGVQSAPLFADAERHASQKNRRVS